MRKFMMLSAVVALVVAALALPALAQDGIFRGDEDRFEARQDRLEERFEEDFFFGEEGFFFGDDRFEDFEDEGFFFFFGDDRDHFDRDDDYDYDDEDRFDGSGVSQSFEQDAESGDVSQSFNVSNSGDNSNQCAGIQGVANTGNAQNQIGVLQYASEADDFDFEDSGAQIEVSPSNSTVCDQQVNQAATAFGGK